MAGLRGWLFVAICGAALLLWLVHRIQTGRLRSEYAIFWGVFGAIAAAFAFFPRLIDVLADLAGIDYAPSLLIVFVGIFSFGYLVHLSEKLSDQRAQIRKLSQQIAMLQAAPSTDADKPDP